MNWQQLLNLIVARIKQVVGLYAFVLIPMWGMFFLNESVLFGLWNIFGIVPRTLDLGSMIGVIASWTMHGNFAHLMGNTFILLQILFLFGLFENNAYRTILKLIVAFLSGTIGPGKRIEHACMANLEYRNGLGDNILATQAERSCLIRRKVIEKFGFFIACQAWPISCNITPI